jgi:pimeloyl-ACP methyl ester carboxylesterase
MPSVEIRVSIVAICVILLVLKRSGFYEWLKEKKKKKARQEAKVERKAQVQEQRRRAEERRGRKETQTAEILRQSVQGLRQKSIEVAGLYTWYLDSGKKNDGPTALLLHGFAGDKENWAAFAPFLLKKGFRVVAPDLPGCGQNPKKDLGFDVTLQTKRVRAFAHQLGLDKLHLVGCSMGGTIAAAWAYGAQDDVLSLTLIEPFGVGVPYLSELDEWLQQDRNPLVIAGPAAYDNMLGFLYAQPPEMSEKLKNHRAEQICEHRSHYLKMWHEVYQGERAKLLDLILPELKAPTLLLLGAKSRVVHAGTAQAVENIKPSIRTVSLENAGHFAMVDQAAVAAEHFLSLASDSE